MTGEIQREKAKESYFDSCVDFHDFKGVVHLGTKLRGSFGVTVLIDL